MNQEAIRKMKLARKYQKEAIMELVPEAVRGNVENIDRELKEIMMKCLVSGGKDLMQAFMSESADQPPAEEGRQTTKVKKVEIG